MWKLYHKYSKAQLLSIISHNVKGKSVPSSSVPRRRGSPTEGLLQMTLKCVGTAAEARALQELVPAGTYTQWSSPEWASLHLSSECPKGKLG